MADDLIVEGLDEPSTQADPADVLIYAPAGLLVSASESVPKTHASNPPRRKALPVSSPEYPYGGYTWLLVRTALIRAQDWSPKARPPIVSDPREIALLCKHLVHADQEHVVALAANNRLEVQAIHEVAVGGTSSAAIELRHLLKVAVLVGATNVALVHNHPSGSPQPSAEDIAMTEVAKAGLKCIGINFLDHVIVAHDGWYSFMAETASSWQ